MLFQGETATVHDLLGLHADARVPTSAVATIRQLLSDMPTLGVGDGITEFLRVWKLWQKGCQEILRTDAAFDGQPELELVLRLLAGDVGVFDELKHFADLWCQLLVARLLYTNPLARFYDLQVRSCAPFKSECPSAQRESANFGGLLALLLLVR